MKTPPPDFQPFAVCDGRLASGQYAHWLSRYKGAGKASAQ